MIDTSTCGHQDQVVPVDTRIDGAVQVVAYLCGACGEQLPLNWGCDDCTWSTMRTFTGESWLASAPCLRHRGDQ